MKSRASTGGLVYSTDSGRMCPACRKPVAQCACKKAATSPIPSDDIVRVSCEKKGRGGKAVTVVRGLQMEAGSLERFAKALKAACGSGGTVKAGAIEVQGDHRAKVMALLAAEGHAVKSVGG